MPNLASLITMKQSSGFSIIHDAIVTGRDLSDGTVRVRVADSQSGECATCAAAMVCGAGKGSELTVHTPHAAELKPGTRVRIGASPSLHRRAVMLMLALPCLALVAGIFIIDLATGSEGLAALTGVGAAALTYAVLYLCRRHLAHKLDFQII